jgi:hypothetical protein
VLRRQRREADAAPPFVFQLNRSHSEAPEQGAAQGRRGGLARGAMRREGGGRSGGEERAGHHRVRSVSLCFVAWRVCAAGVANLWRRITICNENPTFSCHLRKHCFREYATGRIRICIEGEVAQHFSFLYFCAPKEDFISKRHSNWRWFGRGAACFWRSLWQGTVVGGRACGLTYQSSSSALS